MVLSLETYISLLDLDNVTALHSSQVDSVFLQLLNGGGRDRVPWRVVSVCIWRCVCLGLQHLHHIYTKFLQFLVYAFAYS